MSLIIQNAVYIKESDTYLISTHRHDFREDPVTGCFVDGGKEYCRRGGDPEKMENFSLGSASTIAEVMNKLLWGTCGKDGKEPLRHRPIASFDLAHLKAILRHAGDKMSPLHKFVVQQWIQHHQTNEGRSIYDVQ